MSCRYTTYTAYRKADLGVPTWLCVLSSPVVSKRSRADAWPSSAAGVSEINTSGGGGGRLLLRARCRSAAAR